MARDKEWVVADFKEEIEEEGRINHIATFELSDGTIVQQDKQSLFTPPDPGFYQHISYI